MKPESLVGLFPGQGAYRQGGLRRLWEAGDPVTREVFTVIDDVAAERTGRTVSEVVFSPDAPTLAQMVDRHLHALQLAIFGSSLVAYRTLAAAGCAPDVLLGHSLGEIAALVCADGYSLHDGAAIICERQEALAAHAPRDAGMLVLGCGRDRAQRLLALMGTSDLVLAVDNGPAQTVLSGQGERMTTVQTIAAALGLSATPVASAYGFHHPALMATGLDFAQRVAAYPRGRLTVPVYSPILGRYYHDGEDFAGLLGAHLSAPVEFRTAVAALYDAGARIFVETGAGGALGRQVRDAFPLAAALQTLGADDDAAALTAAVAFLADPGKLAATGSSGPDANQAAAWPAHDPQPPSGVPSARPAAVPTRSAILSRLQELYAETLEYPVEVLSEDALLEADLGVDSLRQVDLMARTRRLFGLGTPEPGFRVDDFETLGKIADYVAAVGGDSPPAGADR